MNNKCITYHLDSNNNLTYLSEGWISFASENKASDLQPGLVIGKPLSDFIFDSKSLHLYEMLIQRVKEKQNTIDFPFRCDAPDRRRYMHMKIYPVDDELVGFKSCIVKEEVREPIKLLESDIDRSDDVLEICGWCKKVKIDEMKWVEVEEAVKTLNLFDLTLLPKLSHCICSECLEAASKELD